MSRYVNKNYKEIQQSGIKFLNVLNYPELETANIIPLAKRLVENVNIALFLI